MDKAMQWCIISARYRSVYKQSLDYCEDFVFDLPVALEH